MILRALPLRIALAAAVLVLVLPGCKSTSFVGQRYDNFSAYYNTFYNARQAYAEATKSLEEPESRIDRNAYLPLFPRPAGANANAFQKPVIDRSAELLREHPDSKWVDDALQLIGQAYFYQQNYVGAEQKFREVIGLESGLRDEARFWLARTLIASDRLDEAATFLLAALADEDALDRRWRGRMHLALSGLYVQQERWELSAEQLEKGIELTRDKQLRGRAQFLLGQVYEAQGRFGDAANAYDDVLRVNPPYGLDYAARVNAIRALALDGQGQDALGRVARMQRDDKYYDARAEVRYLRGFVQKELGRPDDAFLTFDALLYDDDPASGVQTVRGPVHYALGELYRDAYQDYVMAAAHFDTASTSLRTPAQSGRGQGGGRGQAAAAPILTRAAITDAPEMARNFGAFAEARESVAMQDSLLELGALGEEEFDARILAIRQQRAREAVALQREQERRQIEQQFAGGGGGTGSFEEGSRNRTTTRAASNAQGGGAGTNTPAFEARQTASNMTVVAAGFLGVMDPIRIQEGQRAFIDRWGPRPLVPNWRRMEAVEAAGLEDTEGGRADLPFDLAEANVEEALPPIDVSAIPRDSVSLRRVRQTRANARYEVANVLFLALGRPDSAATWYRTVIEEDGDFPVSTRAYYALAEVQQSLGDTLSARSLYQQLLAQSDDYELQQRARERLGEATREADRPSADTLALAEAAYEDAYRQWQADRYADALDAFAGLVVSYPETPSAPQALLAAGSTFAEWAQRDSLDLFGPIPFGLPDSLLLAARIAELAPRPEPARDTTALAPDAPESIAPSDSLVASPEESGADRGLDAPDRAADDAEGDARRRDRSVPDRAVLDRRSGRAGTEAPEPFDPARDRAARRDEPEGELAKREGAEERDLRDRTGALGQAEEARAQAASADTARAAIGPDASLPGATTAPLDTAIVADDWVPHALPVDLPRLYEVIASQYGDTPYAPVARRLGATLEARRPRAAIDSTAADSLAGLAADSVLAESPSAQGAPPVAAAPVRDEPLADADRAARRAALGLPPGAPLPGEAPIFDEYDEAPQLIGGESLLRQRLEYPLAAAEENIEADVEVYVVIDEEGVVIEATPARATGSEFEAEAVRVLMESRFTPALVDALPVRSRLRYTVPFRMDSGQ